MTQITEPGIYPGFDIAAYHADPCPTPSLSSSIAKVMVHECPRKAYMKHPRLGKKIAPDHNDKFSLGDAVHSLVLARGKGIVELNYKDWRTDASKDARDKVKAAGGTAILAKDMARARNMEGAIVAQMTLHEMAAPFFAAEGWEVRDEVAIFWTENIDGQEIWCRSLIDRLCVSKDRIVVFDLKSTEASVAPHEISRHMFNMHYQIQAAMIMRGLQVLRPSPIADRLEFHFISAEVEDPHLISVGKVTRQMFILGAKQVAQAIGLWARCMATNNWPGYPRVSVDLAPPSFVETKWLERELSDPSLINVENDPFLVASPWVPREPGRLTFDDVDPT